MINPKGFPGMSIDGHSRLTDWCQLHGTHFQDQRVLITGGAGFIGSHLTTALVQLGAKVTVLDDLSAGKQENLEAARKIAGDRIELVSESILDIDALLRCSENQRYVFHEAALVSVPQSIEAPDRYFSVNVTGTSNVLEAARRQGVERMMLASSSAVYGDTAALPKREDQVPAPLSPYAASKAAGENLLSAYASSYELDTVSLRYFNIFGPGQSADSDYAAVIVAFASALLGDQAVRIYGDGSQTRDFIHIDNVVHGNLLAARCERPLAACALNIASGSAVSVNQLAKRLMSGLERAHLEPKYAPTRAGDVMHSQADISAAKQIIGYEPIVDFDTGLDQTAQWYAQQNVSSTP
jgi:nucleoside-diphosphate-sugar epimerase